jgi:hypothetical protein
VEVSINQITPRMEDGVITSVQVHFTARTADGSINLNGYIPIESSGLIDFAGIETAVRQEVVNRIMTGNVENAE